MLPVQYPLWELGHPVRIYTCIEIVVRIGNGLQHVVTVVLYLSENT